MKLYPSAEVMNEATSRLAIARQGRQDDPARAGPFPDDT
jgi:excinuclease UvrABC nuclease subunit